MRPTLKALGTGILLAQMVFSLVTFNVAFAADYYVDAANGNNAWTGLLPTPGAPNGPKKNLYDGAGGDFSALEIPGLVSGDTINVAAGTYDDTTNGEVFPYDYSTVGNGGTGPLPDGLRIRGSTAAPTIVYASAASSATNGIFYVRGGNYTNQTRIESLTITNKSGPGIKMVADDGETISPTIAGCTVTGCEYEGIRGSWYGATATTATMHPVISACTVTDNGAEGIDISVATNRLIDLDVTVKNCMVTDNDYVGIRVGARGSTAAAVLTVNPSTVSGNGSDGVRFSLKNGATGTATLTGNTIRDNDNDNVDLNISSGGTLNATIKGNTISESVSNDGIYVVASVSANASCTITGNTITDNDDDGVDLQINFGGTLSAQIGAPGLLSRNTITGNGNGVGLIANSAGQMSAIVENNVIDDNDHDGMSVIGQWTGKVDATIISNSISDNGWRGLQMSGQNGGTATGKISQNWFMDNGDEGVTVKAIGDNGGGVGSTASPQIEGNTILYNGDTGLLMSASASTFATCSPWVQDNRIQANGGHGVSMNDNSGVGTCNPDLGDGGTSTGGNWITDNYGTDTGTMTQYYEVYCTTNNGSDISAEGNYWGVIDTTEIDALIYDGNDGGGPDDVDYTPYGDSYTSVIPVSGWTKSYVVAAGTDSTANDWLGVRYKTDGEPNSFFILNTPPVNGVDSTWDIGGNLYSWSFPLGLWNVIEYDAELVAGMWRSNGTYGPGGWAWFSETSLRSKGTEFVIPMSGWQMSKVYIASAKTPGVTTGKVDVYDAGGTLQTTENFTIPHFGAAWRSNDLYALSGAKPCVARVTADRDVTVASGQYKLGSSAGWGDGVAPLAVGKGTDFVFPANGWSRCWFDVANVEEPAAAVTGTMTVYDAGGNPQGAPIAINIANKYGHWRSAPNAIYALAKPAVVRITTTGDVVVRHGRYTTSGDMAGWGYMVMPESFQEGDRFEFPVKGWGKAWVEVANSSGSPINVGYTVYDASGAMQATRMVANVPANGYMRTWDSLPGSIYDYASPAKVELLMTPAGAEAVVTMNCWTSSGAKKAGWATGVIPNSVAP